MATIKRGTRLSNAEFTEATSYSEKRIDITVYDSEVARLIRANLRSNAQAALYAGRSELAEELIHLYNTLTISLDKMEGNKDE